MKKILTYLASVAIALLIVHPQIDYSIPVMVNTFGWLYLAVSAGLAGMFLMRQDIHLTLKMLAVYLFISCFISQAPYLSFNAYILVVATFYIFIWLKNCDFEIIINGIEAAFWLEFILAIFQLAHMDKLLCFDRAFIMNAKLQIVPVTESPVADVVVFGTVMQYMRFASLLVVMSPFLLRKNIFYLIPILFLCIVSKSSTFALSLIVGGAVFGILKSERNKKLIHVVIQFALIFAGTYAIYDWGSIRGAVLSSNGGRLSTWWKILQTWMLDTSAWKDVAHLGGPFSWHWFLFGHGMDTFLPLFPFYKHDFNPFPQAHNSWLQFLWEIGLVGTGFLCVYSYQLLKRLYKNGEYGLVSGLAAIGTCMFFTFPDRMTQSILLLVAYLALCESKSKRIL